MKVLTVMVAVLCITIAVAAYADRERPGTPQSLEDAIKRLQPGVGHKRADHLAKVFREAGDEHGFDPKLLVAISFRESSFARSVEKRKRVGRSRGEIGLMQCHGTALNFRPNKCSKRLEGAWCQIQTGARYLAHIRDNECSGSTWRVLAAYGHGRCLSEYEAQRDRGVRRVMRYYLAIGGSI